MKIAFVYDNLYPWFKGGLDRRIWELAKHVALRGHDAQILTMKRWDGPKIIEREGVRIHGVCNARPLYVNGRRSISQAIWFGGAVMVPLLRERFDVLDVQQFPYFPCFSAQLATSVRAKRWVVTWYEVWGDYWYEYLGKRGAIGKLVEKMVAKLGNAVIADSDHTAEALRALNPKGTIHVVPSGVDLEETDAISWPNKKTDFIFVGRFIKEKNVDLLVRAIAVLRHRGQKVSACLVGDGPERANIWTLIADLGLAEDIHMMGSLSDEDLRECRKTSHVAVLPSRREGFGIVVLEAFAAGLPVVTIDHPQNAATQLVEHGRTGFIADPTPESLAAALLEARNNAASLREACLQEAKRYSWESMADRLLNVYETIAR